MKTYHLFLIAIAIFIITSCSKSSSAAASLHDYLSAGSWYVYQYSENGVNHTDDYGGYQLTFNTDGTFSVHINTTTDNGTWTDNGGNSKLILTMTTSDVLLQKLIKSWNVTSQAFDHIEMKDDSNTEIFHLQKL